MSGSRGPSTSRTRRSASGCRATSAGAGPTRASSPCCARQAPDTREERERAMKPFAYTRASHPHAAVQTVAQEPAAKFLAGGTNLLDLMKEGVEQPDRLVDINRLELARIEERDGGLRLGALSKNSDTANHPLVRARYPLVTQAI